MSGGETLTDAQVALILGKPKRTIQRWCQAGRLEGAWKAGRSWRIPEVAVVAITGEEVTRLRSGLEHAVVLCEALRRDVNAAARAYRRWGRKPDQRDWVAVEDDVARIEAALAGVRREVARYRDGGDEVV